MDLSCDPPLAYWPLGDTARSHSEVSRSGRRLRRPTRQRVAASFHHLSCTVGLCVAASGAPTTSAARTCKPRAPCMLQQPSVESQPPPSPVRDASFRDWRG
ncbi:uncharacterized protein BDR25DRAFT_78840 [Lindgomyces ingoldianus]|uniref:Uncharacterized protein n=1 Tax=Lindgomyces ingoldianus TaxID=673940 RepID=A0ACB6QIS4_9PLEO|nr:uncharacterized protein BDR25DRAFT_78840 [Lindgomyces ingoldianus]KAF2466041.1 hypothetical protein BDR25DRAFT_78840 [Lindgomyces ingoldianus]